MSDDGEKASDSRASSDPDTESPADSGPDVPVAGATSGAPRLRIPAVAWGIGICVALAVPVVMRAVWDGRAELRRADEAQEAGNIDLQIEHLGRAARWRVPVFRHDDEALQTLVALGAEFEGQGVTGTAPALAAYREARRAMLATRAWGVSDPETLSEVNRHIASLMASVEERHGADIGESGDPYAYHLALLDEVPGPNPWRANVAALAFVAWLGTTAMFLLRALNARGNLIPRQAVRWGIGSIVLLLVWIFALRFAS